MVEGERYWHYQICKTRGHQPTGVLLTVSPPLDVCKHCGVHYRYETVLHESNVPKEPDA